MNRSHNEASRFEVVGDFLALRWADGQESFISLQRLRRSCPCARCAGEPDVTGQIHRIAPAPSYGPMSFALLSIEPVGNYALALGWGDGHDTGIYTWELLRELGAAEAIEES